jgi:hypothetical protein
MHRHAPLLLATFWLSATLSVNAQEHPYIAAYALTEFDGGIRVNWTILGGSTCDGQEVERSTDGTTFASVHRIEGLCGDPFIARSYEWVDQAPPEFSTVYYRVKLGVDGYTSIKSVVFDQLTSSDQRFFPSPMANEATLLLNIPSGTPVDLRIWDGTGRLVWERLGIPGPKIELALPTGPAGVYTYTAIGLGRRFSGRFVRL